MKHLYDYEIITGIYFFQIVLKIFRIRIQGLLDPDWDFWLDLDPDSIEYGSETLLVFSDFYKIRNYLYRLITPTWSEYYQNVK